MSYTEGTILVRDTPKGDHLDRVRVIGNSPIHSTGLGEWAGSTGDCIIVQPEAEFGSPENMPVEIANNLYSIDSEPALPPTHVVSAQGENLAGAKAVRQLSAEEQFRIAAKAEAKAKTARVKTTIKTEAE